MFFSQINYVVVIVATIIGMAIGFIWYAPWAFGRLWMKSKGLTSEIMESRMKGKSMWPRYLMTALGTFATAFVLAILFNSLWLMGIWGTILFGALLWLGFVAPVKLNDHVFGGDALLYVLITAGHQLVAIAAMAFIIGIFS